jgi:hypothetical protein
MSSISIAGDSSGSISLTVPSVAGTNTATLPAATGTVMVSGNMPAFYAYSNAGQSVGSGVTAKVAFQAELFDTNNNFDSTTNYRFTPTVAGYYQLNAGVNFGITGRCVIYLYKNGSQFIQFVDVNTVVFELSGSNLVYANGTTDYFEIYVYLGTGSTLSNGSQLTYFSGSLVRSA